MEVNEQPLPPVLTGLKGRCPVCGEGSLFNGLLEFATHCVACNRSFAMEDAGDGPAVFVMFITGFFIVPPAMIFHLVSDAPLWLTLLIFAPIIIVASIILLRLMRGVMFNLQYKHKAVEVRSEDIDL